MSSCRLRVSGRGELSLLPSGSLTWEASRLPLFIRSLGCSDVDGSPVAPLSPLCGSFPLAERVRRARVSPPRAAPPPSLGAAQTGIADLMGRERSSPYLSPLPPGAQHVLLSDVWQCGSLRSSFSLSGILLLVCDCSFCCILLGEEFTGKLTLP